ncbi:hypothetical protein [Halobacteriaceae bacterium SHR40]|uniref:hypothetical protein n=1 Tax=Halovenus amylolytica TaxID=2500550 RepID=UPI000FE2AD7A
METALDALPAQPLTAEDVATLNESATVRLIPYTWYGEQVIAILLLHDTRDHTDETAIEDATEELESEVADDEPESDATDAETNDTDDKKKAFGTHQSNTVGTVEVIDDGSFAPDTEEDEPDDAEAEEIEAETTETKLDPGTDSDGSSTDAEEELHVYAAGYDDSEATWVVIAEIDPDTEFTDAEPLIREWISDTYHDQIVDRLAVGPSEYEVEGA